MEMTDNDIKKALEDAKARSICVGECDCNNKEICTEYLAKCALDLINRQKAEIERLHNILLSFTNEVHTWSNKNGYDTTGLSLIPILNEAESVRETIKAEAIKEFAERLKESKYQSSDWSHGEHPFVVEESDIDNLVEEMAGDSDA